MDALKAELESAKLRIKELEKELVKERKEREYYERLDLHQQYLQDEIRQQEEWNMSHRY